MVQTIGSIVAAFVALGITLGLAIWMDSRKTAKSAPAATTRGVTRGGAIDAEAIPAGEGRPMTPAAAAAPAKAEPVITAKSIQLFVAMFLGILAREAYNLLVNHTSFNWVGFAIASLISPIIFIPIWTQYGNQTLDLTVLLLAFQNGFFWNSVFEGIKGAQ